MGRFGSMTIKGGAELQRKLRQLEPKLSKQIFRKALRSGARIIRDEARRLVPVDSGLTKEAINVKAGKGGRKKISVNIAVGEGDYKGDTFYAAFLEYGHFSGSRKRGDDRTFVEARPFMRPAFDAKKAEAADEIVRQIAAGIYNVSLQGRIVAAAGKAGKKFGKKAGRAGRKLKRFGKRASRNLKRTGKRLGKQARRTSKRIGKGLNKQRKSIVRRFRGKSRR